MYKFNDNDAVKSNFWKLEKVGDSIQGTLIRKSRQTNQLTGQEQNIYELKLENGEYWNVGGKPGIDAQMRNVKLGQIVEFKYIEERPSKKKGMDPAKIVQVFANRNVVDKEWLEENETEINSGESTTDNLADEIPEEIKVDNVPFNDTPEEKNAKIIALARVKLGVVDEERVKEAVMEATGLAYVSSFYDKIIETLSKM